MEGGSVMFFRKYICADCGKKCNPIREKKGSSLILLILLLFMLIPGLIYMVWAMTGRRMVCPHCKSVRCIKLKTPRGRALAEDFGYKVK